MKDQVAERLSALLDGELNGHDQDRAVTSLIGEQAQAETFGRYRLIGDIIRGESTVIAEKTADRVSAALADEPTVLAPAKTERRWAKPAAGFALAASVAVTAVVVAPGFMQAPTTTAPAPAFVQTPIEPPVQLVATGPNSKASPNTVATPAQWQTLDPELSERLNRLVIEHHEFGGRTGIKGPVAHIGLVNYAGR